MMDYKVIEYRCGCKYILLSDKSIFKGGKCPTHWKNQKSVTLWCCDCHKKLTVKPQVGHRQKRCSTCSKKHAFEVNKENWRTKYAGKYKQSGQIRYTGKEPASVKAERIIGEVFDGMRRKYKPVWGTVC